MQSSLQETLDVVLRAIKVQNDESEPLGLWVTWFITMIQAFNDIFDAAILSVPVCGEDVEVTERFTYLGSENMKDEEVVVGGDLNGHMGRSTDGFERVHGGYGCGVRNN